MRTVSKFWRGVFIYLCAYQWCSGLVATLIGGGRVVLIRHCLLLFYEQKDFPWLLRPVRRRFHYIESSSMSSNAWSELPRFSGNNGSNEFTASLNGTLVNKDNKNSTSKLTNSSDYLMSMFFRNSTKWVEFLICWDIALTPGYQFNRIYGSGIFYGQNDGVVIGNPLSQL